MAFYKSACRGSDFYFMLIISEFYASSANAEGAFLVYTQIWEVKILPSEKVLQQKKEAVEVIKNKLSSSVAGVIVDYRGISVADDTKLRKELREAGVDYSVVKNTLLRFAANETGFEGLTGCLEGTTALAVSNEDPVAAAKILQKFADNSKGNFSLKAGYVEGKILDQAGIEQLAKLPNKEQLLVQLLSVLNGNIRGLAVALNAIAEKKGEEVVA